MPTQTHAAQATPPEPVRDVDLSVVIPAYNERDRIHPTLDGILAYVRRRQLAVEVIVVDDGSSDGTAQSVEERGDPEISVLRLPQNCGKGAAVRCGMLAGRGMRVLLSDADLSTPIEEIERLEPALAGGFSVACGSRALRASAILRQQPSYRRRLGQAFNVFVRLLALSSFRDTQCGFKLFDGDAAQAIFACCSTDGFAFDVECLYVAKRLGHRVAEVPVVWSHVPESRVTIPVESMRMLWDLFRIRIAASRYSARTLEQKAANRRLTLAQRRGQPT